MTRFIRCTNGEYVSLNLVQCFYVCRSAPWNVRCHTSDEHYTLNEGSKNQAEAQTWLDDFMRAHVLSVQLASSTGCF